MGSRGASANSSKGAMGGLLDGEYSSRLTKKEGHTGGYRSRYANAKTFTYDGDTFIVDDDKRGGTTADGKRSMMFPDEILFARANMIQQYTKDGTWPSTLRNMKERLVEAKGRYSDAADERTNNNLIKALDKALGK